MRQAIRFTFTAAAACLVSTLALSSAGFADAPIVPGGPVEVSEVSATPASEGECSSVGLRIYNAGERALQLLAIESPIAARAARLLARIGDTHTVVFQSLPVLAGDEVSLQTTHLSFELCGLEKDLKPGESFPARLVFAEGAIPIEVHVHTPDVKGIEAPYPKH